jgi:nicotinamidase-related amidase
MLLCRDKEQTMGHLRDLCDADNAVLLVIDVQGKLFEMTFNHDRFKPLVAKMLKAADLFSVPVLLTEQYPRGLGHTDPELKSVYDALETDKHLLEKTSFGCCGDAGFNETLGQVTAAVHQRRGGDDPKRPVDIIVTGAETQVCVQQTVLELLTRQGYRVVVLEDVTGGRVEAYHDTAIARFRQCGAVITCYESVLFEWTRTKDDPRFKAMSAIVKG